MKKQYLGFACFLLLSSCSFFSPQSHSLKQEELRWHKNVSYAANFFEKEAPDCGEVPIVTNETSVSSLQSIDTLLHEQLEVATEKTAVSVLCDIVNHSVGSELLSPKPLQEAEEAISSDKCHEVYLVVSAKNKAVRVSILSSFPGKIGLTAYVQEHLKKTPCIRVPELLGIEVDGPCFFLIEKYEQGQTVEGLIATCGNDKGNALEHTLGLLGQSLGRVHTSINLQKKPLPEQWKKGAQQLIETLTVRYKDRPNLLHALQSSSQFLNKLFVCFDNQSQLCSIGSLFENVDLQNFLLLPDGKSLLFLGTYAQGKGASTAAYEYARILHHLTLLSSMYLKEPLTTRLKTAFEKGYEETAGSKPSRKELVLFSLLDLLSRLEHPGKSTISIPRLEDELIQWNTTLQKLVL